MIYLLYFVILCAMLCVALCHNLFNAKKANLKTGTYAQEF